MNGVRNDFSGAVLGGIDHATKPEILYLQPQVGLLLRGQFVGVSHRSLLLRAVLPQALAMLGRGIVRRRGLVMRNGDGLLVPIEGALGAWMDVAVLLHITVRNVRTLTIAVF